MVEVLGGVAVERGWRATKVRYGKRKNVRTESKRDNEWEGRAQSVAYPEPWCSQEEYVVMPNYEVPG